MKIAVLTAQIVLGLALAYGGYWLYAWHQAHPNANRNEVSVQTPPPGAPTEEVAAQEVIKGWIKENLRDPNATIKTWGQIVPVRGNHCVVAAIEGNTRSGKTLVRTYVFEYKGREIVDVKSGEDFVKSLKSDAREAATAEEEAQLKTVATHIELMVAAISKGDTPS